MSSSSIPNEPSQVNSSQDEEPDNSIIESSCQASANQSTNCINELLHMENGLDLEMESHSQSKFSHYLDYESSDDEPFEDGSFTLNQLLDSIYPTDYTEQLDEETNAANVSDAAPYFQLKLKSIVKGLQDAVKGFKTVNNKRIVAPGPY